MEKEAYGEKKYEEKSLSTILTARQLQASGVTLRPLQWRRLRDGYPQPMGGRQFGDLLRPNGVLSDEQVMANISIFLQQIATHLARGLTSVGGAFDLRLQDGRLFENHSKLIAGR